MGIPSENKNQVTRTREEPDPAAASIKRSLMKSGRAACAVRTSSRATCARTNCRITPSSIRSENAKTSESHSGLTEDAERNPGLQDDHDPRDVGQQQNEMPPKQPAGPYDRDKQSGKVDEQGLPTDDSKFG